MNVNNPICYQLESKISFVLNGKQVVNVGYAYANGIPKDQPIVCYRYVPGFISYRVIAKWYIKNKTP